MRKHARHPSYSFCAPEIGWLVSSILPPLTATVVKWLAPTSFFKARLLGLVRHDVVSLLSQPQVFPLRVIDENVGRVRRVRAVDQVVGPAIEQQRRLVGIEKRWARTCSNGDRLRAFPGRPQQSPCQRARRRKDRTPPTPTARHAGRARPSPPRPGTRVAPWPAPFQLAPTRNAIAATISGKRRYAKEESSDPPCGRARAYNAPDVGITPRRCHPALRYFVPKTARLRHARAAQARITESARVPRTFIAAGGHGGAEQQRQRRIARHRIVFLGGRKREENQHEARPAECQQAGLSGAI